MTGSGVYREGGAGTYRDGVAEPDCTEVKERQYDLEATFRALLAASPALRAAYERRRREIPGMTIHFEIDLELDEKRRKSGLPKSGGGTTTGECGDTQRAIIIDPVAICTEGNRDLTRVLLHELGHVLRCRKGMTTEEDHQSANQFADEVERQIYPDGPRRNPFQPPTHLRQPSSTLHGIRGALGAATAVLGLVSVVVRLIERLIRKR